MPPKPKFTKDEIVTAAFELARAEGAQALTAREVGRRLGVSSSPIFTVFTDMAELHAAVEGRAEACFKEYMAMAEDYAPAYKKRGMQWVRFAQDEPMLFRLLFMSARGDALDFDRAQQIIPFGKETDIAIIMRDYHATREQAEHLFRQMWIYTYGLCSLCAAKVCRFSDEEIAVQLGEVFAGMVYVLRSGSVTAAVQPVEKGDIEKLKPGVSVDLSR